MDLGECEGTIFFLSVCVCIFVCLSVGVLMNGWMEPSNPSLSRSELVYSVKEGWRREDPMKAAEEMMYFSMVCTCLQYQRLKIQEEHKKRHLATSKTGGGDTETPWVPDLRNVTVCETSRGGGYGMD